MESTWIFIIAGILILFFLLSHTIYITTSNVPSSPTYSNPICGTTPYGCCPDGINYKMNFLGTNCPASPQNPYTVGTNTGPNPYLNREMAQQQIDQSSLKATVHSVPGSSTAPILPIRPSSPPPHPNIPPPSPYVTANIAATTAYPNDGMILPSATSIAPIVANHV